MPIDISSIPSSDREDFQKRLQVYGIDINAVQEPLSVADSSVVHLAFGPNRSSARQPHVLETTDLAQVKRWVGLEDRIGQRLTPSLRLPGRIDLGSRIPGVVGRPVGDAAKRRFQASPGMMMDEGQGAAGSLSDDELRMLDSEDIDNVRLAARAFVRGDSRLVSSFQPLFSRVIGKITVPVWPLLSIYVARGAVLEFGTGVHALVAYEVTIEDGGKIVSRGHLSVSCTKMQQGGRRRFVGPDLRTGPTISAVAGRSVVGGFRPIFSE